MLQKTKTNKKPKTNSSLIKSSRLTVSKEALVVLESSGMFFFPVQMFLRFLRTSLLKTTWKKKMKTP